MFSSASIGPSDVSISIVVIPSYNRSCDAELARGPHSLASHATAAVSRLYARRTGCHLRAGVDDRVGVGPAWFSGPVPARVGPVGPNGGLAAHSPKRPAALRPDRTALGAPPACGGRTQRWCAGHAGHRPRPRPRDRHHGFGIAAAGSAGT